MDGKSITYICGGGLFLQQSSHTSCRAKQSAGHQQAASGRPCQYIFQPRYRVVASCTAGATEERVAATWCSKPFSQMEWSSFCIWEISTTPAPPKAFSGSSGDLPWPT